MKFEQLFFLKEAVKYQSISVAAEKNFISQSSVSYAISKLEKELSIDLLKRTNSGVTPTLAGEMVLQKSESIFKATEEIVEISNRHRNDGEVNIACIPCICDWILPKVLQILKRRADDILVSVETEESNSVARHVSSGISEFGILIRFEELERNTELRYTPLFRDEYVLYVGRKSPFWNRSRITYAELVQEPYIAYQDEFRRYNGGLTNMIGANKLPNIIFRTDNLDSIKNMIMHDNYVAFFPSFMSENDLYVKSGWIRRITVSDKKLDFEVGYVESAKYKTKKIDQIFLTTLSKMIEGFDLSKMNQNDL
ncbi:LysR family transcriptional regulator [Sporolactobacillus shoreicorticis]|uniref:LysR family transcriptional regulator n=1 Tax=Sporolactobacillus shoreicorticis TaxID=1923877 RepID=A0ABW5S419_9BACL|nr:LysR family transcriptional regulator [Sporolactobacillus shoreicorticis]MCO7124405.1 LysR family transcriptional regulator [Sporolactobacillus shoreicorticis]